MLAKGLLPSEVKRLLRKTSKIILYNRKDQPVPNLITNRKSMHMKIERKLLSFKKPHKCQITNEIRDSRYV